MVTENGAVNAGVQKVQDQEVQQLAEWVGEWPMRRRRRWEG